MPASLVNWVSRLVLWDTTDNPRLPERRSSPAVLTYTTIVLRLDLPVTKERSFAVAAHELLVFKLLLVFHHVLERIAGVRSVGVSALAHAARVEEVVATVALDQSLIFVRDKTVVVLTLRWVIYGKGGSEPEWFVAAAFLLRRWVGDC